MHRSRHLAIALILIVLFITAFSQAAYTQEARMLRVGAVSLRTLAAAPHLLVFLKRMEELGYVQGRNFVFEFVQAPNAAGYEGAYQELAKRELDIMLASGPEIALKSALAVAGSLPIVMIAVDYDPLTRGYVPNLARPGGNVTGLFLQQIELTGKRLQLMQEAFPDVKAVTVFWDRISADQWQATQSAAARLGLHVHGIKFSVQPYDFERAWAEVAAEYRGALIVLASPVFTVPERRRLPDFALRHRIPTMVFISAYVRAGALMSYGASFTGMFRRAAEYVDRIAKGAEPAELPIEQPTKFELVVNLKTAEALGITLPAEIMLRADEVIK